MMNEPRFNKVVASIIDTDGHEVHRMEPVWDEVGMFAVAHSCGDCGFVGNYDQFTEHLTQPTHLSAI